ncbi:MAG TPA: methionine ABC transporter permease [Clostridiaceae bacterium]|nr:methionine ABC transporter permease [Clostridiaceae bacterium]
MWPAIVATIRMMSISMILATILSFIIAIILVMTNPTKGLRPCKWVHSTLSFIVNTVRSFPFIVLIVAIAPVTRLVMGTMIGEAAAIFPLTVGGAPFMARIIENALLDVDPQLIEAAKACGASDLQIVLKVMLREAIPSVINGSTLCAINFLKSTTMAGAVGAGGLGSVALNYGFYSFNYSVLYTGVILLLVMIQAIQLFGDYLYKHSIK